MALDKEDRAIRQLTNSIGLMTYMALYDKFGFKEQKLRNYYGYMEEMKNQWADGIIPTAGMLKYCEQKKIDAYGWVKSIPTSKKMKLIGKNVTPNILKFIESGMLANVLMTVIVLKEKYRFSNEKINEYLYWIDFYIDSYTKNEPKSKFCYMSDKLILDIFKDELKLDLESGRKVA